LLEIKWLLAICLNENIMLGSQALKSHHGHEQAKHSNT